VLRVVPTMTSSRDRPARRAVSAAARDASRITEQLRPGQAVEQVRHRGKTTLRERIHRVHSGFWLALQAGLAAALAWIAAHELLHNPDPIFAPISAVGTLASSVGQRLRRTIELIFGVAIGVLVGDALIYVLGTGPWQLGLIVTLAIITALVLSGSVAVVVQSAATAVLIVTLTPSVRDVEFPRFIDALLGGGAALLVSAVLLPLNPLRVINRAAKPALDLLANELTATAEALRGRDKVKAERALDGLRENKDELDALSEAIEGAKEATTLSPARWHRRSALAHYVEAKEPIDRAMRNSGTLIRRSITLIEDEEPIPDAMPSAISDLGESVRRLRHEFSTETEPHGAREQALTAVREAGRAYAEGVSFSGSVVVAQVRTAASDLLKASGLDQGEANRLVRHAFAEGENAVRAAGPRPHEQGDGPPS
jgi:uncharacterized membrane protein YgaE (UPF0421/DUF939 family)